MTTADTATAPASATGAEDETHELHRCCVFELDLSCGHTVTVTLDGWYPVSVACCDRLGGAWTGGTFHPFNSTVEHARCLEERYEHRSAGTHPEPLRLLDRRARTDDPTAPSRSWQRGSAGRFPVRVGGPIPDRGTQIRS